MHTPHSLLLLVIVLFAASGTLSCTAQQKNPLSSLPADIRQQVQNALNAVRMDEKERDRIIAALSANPAGFATLVKEVRASMSADPDLLRRVDKRTALASDFVPADLVPLEGPFPYVVSKKGMQLRKPARDALVRMAESARNDGITLVISSAYRSYDYQKKVYAENAAEMGEAEAARVSALPGHSQHQLGTAIDFGTINDGFAETAQGRWLAANAGRFGFSLSYPMGMEHVTGYKWESWHYRYIGTSAVELQNAFFLGIQQYLIEFLAGLK